MYNVVIESQEQFEKVLKQYNYRAYKYDNYIDRFQVFKELLEGKITNKVACSTLGLSKSQVKKIKKKVRNEGYKALIHKLKGSQRTKKFSIETIALLVSLYNGSYAREVGDNKYDFSESNYSHFHRHLTSKEGDLNEFGIKISLSHLRTILNNHGFVSVASKRFKKSYSHKGRRLGRRYLPGERWEIDGTFYDWLSTGETRCIHVVYDRGLEAPIAMYMADGETTTGYYGAFAKALSNYGIPKRVIGDRRSSFYNGNKEEVSERYDTRFNNVLDKIGVEYEYSSNSNAKPGVESFNKDLKTNLVNDFKRHGIGTMEEANEYLKKYVLFKQKELNMKKEDRHGKKINKKIFEDLAIAKKVDLQIGKKGRIYTSKVEYEVFKDDKLVQLPKGTKVQYTESINGNKYLYLNKRRYDLKVSIEVAKETYEQVAVINKELKVKDDMTIRYGGVDYVILKNDGKHIELDTYTKMLYQEREGKRKVFYNGCTYSVVAKEAYAFEYKIRPRKECGVKFHCMIRYDGEDYVLVDNNKKIAYQPDEVNKLLIKYYIDGLYAFSDDMKVNRLELLSECKEPIPNSYIQAKRYRDHQ